MRTVDESAFILAVISQWGVNVLTALGSVTASRRRRRVNDDSEWRIKIII